LSAFVRISADSPFIDPATVDMVAGRYAAGDVDLSTNVHPRSFPIGESAEAISTEALGLVLASSRDPADREHVTRYIYLHPDRFRIGNVSAAAGRYAGVSLSVDTAAEFAKASWIAGRLGDGLETASLDQLVELERDWHRQGQPGGIDEAKPN
jgi:spore coat polysaccharide biosynthesis protein SpsF